MTFSTFFLSLTLDFFISYSLLQIPLFSVAYFVMLRLLSANLLTNKNWLC